MQNSSAVSARARSGRMLVECLVAMLLLNASALVVVNLARGARRSQETAQLTTASWGLATQAIETSVAARCADGPGLGAATWPRVSANWMDHAHVGWRGRNVRVVMMRSPLSGGNSAPLSVDAAWMCQ